METVNINTESNLLTNGELLTGKVKKPFIQDGKLMGAVLSFDGRTETALLHRKQMIGSRRDKRLSSLQLGAEVLVKLIVSGEHPARKTWASELDVDNSTIVDRVKSASPKPLAATVINATDYGVFCEIQEGPAAGRRGLIHAKNLTRQNGPATLGTFTSYFAGDEIRVRVLNAHIDDKNTLRLDLSLA